MLFGSNLPTLGSVGGLLGSLFGGGGISMPAITPGVLGYTPGYTPGFASGTDYAPGGWSWVGENGPELLNLPRGSRVLNHDEAKASMRTAVAANDGTAPSFYFDLRGAVLTQDLLDQMNEISRRHSVSAVQAGIQSYDNILDSRIRPVIHDAVGDPRRS